MKYQIGDNIIINLTNEEGKVIEILNEKMVMIEVKGVKFPAYMDQIDFPYFKMFSKQLAEKPKPTKVYIDDVKREKPKPTQKENTGVWLSMFPVISSDTFGDDVIEFFKIYLLNQTEHRLTFEYNFIQQGSSVFEFKNELLPYHDFYVHDVAIEAISDNPKFDVILSLTNPIKNKAEYVETQYKLKGKKVFEQVQLLKETGQASIKHLLITDYPSQEKQEKLDLSKLTNNGLKVLTAKDYINQLPTARTVIDIHIEKIVHNHKHLSNSEIINLQMQEFEKWYNIAVQQNAPLMIVVHGIGDGVLKNEVHEFLKYKKAVSSFFNTYHPSFGYGATEIKFNVS